ncbi:MAG: TolC family protein, partial [Acidobacteriota bacterium]
MRARLLVLLVAIGAPATAEAQPTPPAPPLTLAELEQMALEANPTLAVAQARIEMARGQARQAGAWPNPTAGYSAEEIKSGGLDRRGEYGFFVEQMIPLGGKLRLSREVFDRSAQKAERDLALQRHRVRLSVRVAYFEALTSQRRVELLEGLAALASEAIAVTGQLYNVGAADRPDFLESEIEARRVALELDEAKNDGVARRQRLASVVGRDEVAGRPLAGSIDEGLPEIGREPALRDLLDQSPQLQSVRAELARAEAATALSRRDSFPDLFLRGGAAYNRERGEVTGQPIGWEGTVEAGISLPIFNRNVGAVAAARAEETRVRAELHRVELVLRSQFAEEFARYLTSLRAVETYRTEILPRAEEALRLYLARYREVAAAYPQVLIAQRSLFELSSRYVLSLEGA